MNTKTFNELLADMHHLERMHLLMTRRTRQRNLEWLEHALQSAVSVEFSTIPPYLSALWSIKDQMHPVAASIRNVVQEEMLHMALACNMLTALGRVPKINDPKMVPSYPGKIPGGVHPELTVSLSGLSDASLDAFIAIEAPSVGRRPQTPEQGKGYKTIGAFYQCDPRRVPNAKTGAFHRTAGRRSARIYGDGRSPRRGSRHRPHYGPGGGIGSFAGGRAHARAGALLPLPRGQAPPAV